MLKQNSIISILILNLITASCGYFKQTNFPGFIRVSTKTASPYFIDPNSISTTVEDDVDVVSFMTIALEENKSYQLLQISTDCSSSFRNSGGSLYQVDGRMLQAIAGDEHPVPFDEKSGLTKVALEVCGTAAQKRFPGGAFEPGSILTALFRNYDRHNKTSRVVVKDESSRKEGTLSLILESRFQQGGIEKHLLVTSTAVDGEDCHACGAKIGAYVFGTRGGHWLPEISDRQVDQWGSWGGGVQANLVKFGPDIYGFSLIASDIGQGISNTSESLIAPVDGHFKPVLQSSISDDNSGDCDPANHPVCYESHSKLSFLSSAHQLFDIDLIGDGTVYADGAIVPVCPKRHYVFNGEKYVEQMENAQGKSSGTLSQN